MYELTAYMTGCNGFQIKKRNKWPKLPKRFDLRLLEEQALRLQKDDAEVFADGEESEVDEIISAYNITELNEFLNSAFDGEVSKLLALN